MDWLLNVQNLDLKILFNLIGLWVAYQLFIVRLALGPLTQDRLAKIIADSQSLVFPSYWPYSVLGFLYLFLWVTYPVVFHAFGEMVYLNTDGSLIIKNRLSNKKEKIQMKEIQMLELTFTFAPTPRSLIAKLRELRKADKFGHLSFRVSFIPEKFTKISEKFLNNSSSSESANVYSYKTQVNNVSNLDLQKFLQRLSREGFNTTKSESTEEFSSYLVVNHWGTEIGGDSGLNTKMEIEPEKNISEPVPVTERFNNPTIARETFKMNIVTFWIFLLFYQLTFYLFLFSLNSVNQQRSLFNWLLYYNFAMFFFYLIVTDSFNVFNILTVRGMVFFAFLVGGSILIMIVLQRSFSKFLNVYNFNETIFAPLMSIGVFFAVMVPTFFYIFYLNYRKNSHVQIYEVNFSNSSLALFLFRWLFFYSAIILIILANVVILLTVYFTSLGDVLMSVMGKKSIYSIFIVALIFVEVMQVFVFSYDLFKRFGVSGVLMPTLGHKIKPLLFYLLMLVQLFGIVWGMIAINWGLGILGMLAFFDFYLILVYLMRNAMKHYSNKARPNSVYFYSLYKQL